MKRLMLLAVGLLTTGYLTACAQAEPDDQPVTHEEMKSPQDSLFGIRIGKPLTLPDCKKSYESYDEPSESCKTKDAVYLKRDQRPDFIDGNRVDVTFDEKGNVKKIHADLNKWGIDDAKEAMLSKFGPSVPSMPNIYIWRFSDYTIDFSGGYESGFVEMQSTANADAETDAFEKRKEAEQNKL